MIVSGGGVERNGADIERSGEEKAEDMMEMGVGGVDEYDENLLLELEAAVRKSKSVSEKLANHTYQSHHQSKPHHHRHDLTPEERLQDTIGNPPYNVSPRESGGREEVDALNQHITQLLNVVRRQEMELSRHRSLLTTTSMNDDDHHLNDAADFNQFTRHADLVAELFEASKRRDLAMVSRMRRAGEDKEEALKRVKMLEEKLEWYMRHHGECRAQDEHDRHGYQHTYEASDTLHELVTSRHVNDIERNTDKALRHIQSNQTLRDKVGVEEMKSILDDRDEARDKCLILEKRVIELEREFTNRNTCEDGAGGDQLKMRLNEAEREAKESRDELDKLRLYYSLYGSLSQEASLAQQYRDQLKLVGQRLEEQAEVVRRAERERVEVGEELRGSREEQRRMMERMREGERRKEEIEQECERLQRLVSVLRKKVSSGVGSSP